MIALLKLINAGLDSGPFNLYSNVDGYTTAFKSNVSRAELISPLGYSTAAPYNTTIVRIKSTGVCPSIIDVTLSPYNCSFVVNATETTIIEPPIVSIPTVTIGTQTWMTKNLDVSTYRDGTLIPQASTNDDWMLARQNKTGAWCYYSNTTSNGTTYGKLYNWYAVMGITATESTTPTAGEIAARKQLAPLGYHVPSDAEWTTLTNVLGGENVAGGKLKSTGTTALGTGLWKTPNSGATNSSGFSGLPGGYRLETISNTITFDYIGAHAYWWSSTANLSNSLYAYCRAAFNSSEYISNINYYNKGRGFSVRLIKD